MNVRILIPTPLRAYTGGENAVEVTAPTVGEALRRLVEHHPDLRRHLFGDDGRLRSFVSVFVNEDDIRALQREDTRLGEKDVVSIVPSVAGGAGDDPRAVATPEALEAARAAARSAGKFELPLSHEEVRRYSRHLILPEVGLEGQVRLKQGRVLLVGAGGLGSPLALYLAAAGVGTLGVVDFDRK